MTPDERLDVICGAAAAVVRAIGVSLAVVAGVVVLLLLAEVLLGGEAPSAAPTAQAVRR